MFVGLKCQIVLLIKMKCDAFATIFTAVTLSNVCCKNIIVNTFAKLMFKTCLLYEKMPQLINCSTAISKGSNSGMDK